MTATTANASLNQGSVHQVHIWSTGNQQNLLHTGLFLFREKVLCLEKKTLRWASCGSQDCHGLCDIAP